MNIEAAQYIKNENDENFIVKATIDGVVMSRTS